MRRRVSSSSRGRPRPGNAGPPTAASRALYIHTKVLPYIPALPKPKSAFTPAMVATGLQKAKREAVRLFPGQGWISYGDRIFVSSRKPINARSGFAAELEAARILRDRGYTVRLAPEIRSAAGKKFDALVNGFRVEIKTVSGNANSL